MSFMNWRSSHATLKLIFPGSFMLCQEIDRRTFGSGLSRWNFCAEIHVTDLANLPHKARSAVLRHILGSMIAGPLREEASSHGYAWPVDMSVADRFSDESLSL